MPRRHPRRCIRDRPTFPGGAPALALAIVAMLAGCLGPAPNPTASHVAPSVLGEPSPTDPSVAVLPTSIPEIDPVPWTTVEWRVVSDAIKGHAVAGRDRIDDIIAGGPGLIAWGRVDQPGRNQFNDMAAIYRSADGHHWQVVPLDDGVGPLDGSEISIVAAGPIGDLALGDVCCTGEEQPALWRSVDAVAWERLAYPAELGDSALYRLIATSDQFVVVGELHGRARIWSSLDGQTWRGAGDVARGLGRGSVQDVASTDDGFIAVGRVEDDSGHYDGAVWRSSDGLTWNRQRVDLLEGDLDAVVTRVIPWADGLLLLGQEGNHDERIRCEQAGSVGEIQPPAPGTRDFMCGWGREVHWITRDGSTWQRVIRVGEIDAPPARPGELIEFRLLAAGGPGLVSLGEGQDDGGASVFVSSDGISWQATRPRPQWKGGIVPAGFVIFDRTIVGVGDGLTVQIGTVR